MGSSLEQAGYTHAQIMDLLWPVPLLEHLKTVELRVADITQRSFLDNGIPCPSSAIKTCKTCLKLTEKQRRAGQRWLRKFSEKRKELLHDIEERLLQVKCLEKVTLEVYQWQHTGEEKVNVASKNVLWELFPKLELSRKI